MLQMALFHSFYGLVVFHCIYYHIFFIYSSVNGHLGCFHVLVIVNSAAMNTGMHVSFRIMFFSRYMPRSGIAGSYGNRFFQFFKETPYCSPQWLHQFTFPPAMKEGSLFSTPSPAFVICRLFKGGHSDQCEVIPYCSFDFHFSNNQ